MRRLLEVGVCTYRRAHLGATLRSISQLVLPDDMRLRVIVADNDRTPSARPLVNEVASETGLDVLYVHAPFRNVAIARNACLEAAQGPWLAFLDDDQTVDEVCLSVLLKRLEAGRLAAVFGITRARYPDTAPAWMVELDTHSDIPVYRKGCVLTGFSGNVLIDLSHAAVKGLRFDPAHDRGGEDTAFFFRVRQQGGAMAIADNAIAHAPVDPARLSFGWLVSRKFRAGIHYGQGLGRGDRLLSVGKCLFCWGMAGVLGWHRVRCRFWAIRAVFHAGVGTQLFL